MARKPIYKRVWPYIVVGVLVIGGIGGSSGNKDEAKPTEPPVTKVVITKAPEKELTKEALRTVQEETSTPKATEPVKETEAPLQTLAPVAAAEQPIERSTPQTNTAFETAAPEPTPAPTQPPQANVQSYVINTSSGKFHLPWCSSCDKISAGNRWDVMKTRDEVLAMGYVPCKNCNP